MMRLIQVKARCVEGVRDSGWFVPGRETTLIHDPNGRGGRTIHLLFGALQALNPPYAIAQEKPFLFHPKIWKQGSHARKVIPEKKTAIIMVFSAVPDLVRELAEFDESLFETDRIEVGRRLDYSRWITFVEISASGRWSDVREGFMELSSLVRTDENWADHAFIDNLLDTDRLKGELATKCRSWLNWVKETVPDLDGSHSQMLEQCLLVVNQARRFNEARRRVEKWLPPTLAIRCAHYGEGGVLSGETIADAPAGYLLQKFTGKKAGTWQDSLESKLNTLGSIQAFKELTERPRLINTSHGIEVEALDADSYLRYWQKYLYLVCLLSLLSNGRLPLLLLDLSDGVDQGELAEFSSWLLKLGKDCQLIVGTDSEIIAEQKGWQSVLRVAAGGLEEQGLIKE